MAGSALAAAVVAGYARTVVFDLTPEDADRSVRRFAGGTRDVDVDPRPFWAHIPRLLPGTEDAWAGGGAHALRLPLGARLARRLQLYLDTDAESRPVPRLTVAVNEAPLATVRLAPGGRARVWIPAGAFADGAPVRLSLVNESAPAITWRRIRLVHAAPEFVWRHLGRRGRFPPESAALLAVSIGLLAVWALGRPEASGLRRVTGAGPPVAGGVLLAAALVLPRDWRLVADVPRWAWLALPWLLLPFRPRVAARQTRARTARGVLLNGAISLTALVLSLGLAELALRVVFREVKSSGDERAFFSHFVYEANSLGFREREFDARKPAGVYRIAVVGDSFTYGGGVPTPERFSNRLERELNARRRTRTTYEVLNFGRPGWDTQDHVRALQRLVLGMRPDFVLVQWFVNDFENHDHSGRPRPHPLLPFPRLHARLLRASALYSLLDPQWNVLQEKLGVIPSHAMYMERRFGDPEGPDSVYEVEQLKAVIATCREREVGIGFVLFPRVGPDLTEGRYAYGYLHDRVLEVCRAEETPCLDLRGPFAAHRNYKELWVTPLDGHPSALANRLAAERIMETFGPRWLAAGG